MPTVLRSGRVVHYTQHGEGPGVVLVPGLGSGATLFGTLPRRFARAGFTCCAVDPVGFPPSGSLPGGVFDFAAAAEDVRAVAATLPKPVALIGTSLGGKIALTAAAAARSSVAGRLVMLSSSALPTPRSKRIHRWFELLCTQVDAGLLGELTAPFLFGETFLNARPGVVDDIVRSQKSTEETRALMRAQALALQAFDGTNLCAGVTWPTLCLAGAEDCLTPPSEVSATAARITGALYHCVDGAGHSLLLESAAAFDRIVAFLRN
ncbi:MAG TPA: alpha/beta hydrolase [Planctomycetota bacterium]|nr:alpha/beta hydrolase [Planctomycetota bacterium]